MGDIEQRRRSASNPARRCAMWLSASTLSVILVCAVDGRGAERDAASDDGAVATALSSVASPCETSERRVLREERPLWRRALALPADALEAAFWPLRQTLFWMERDDVPDRVRDAILHPIDALSGGAAEKDSAR